MDFCVQAELSLSQKKVCNELSRLKGDEVEDDVPDASLSLAATLQVPLLFSCGVNLSKDFHRVSHHIVKGHKNI